MPVDEYGLLRGRVRAREAVHNHHQELVVEAGGVPYTVSFHVTSREVDHELLYYFDADYDHELVHRLRGEPGFVRLADHAPPALDYVRGQLFDTWRMRPVPVGIAPNDLAAMIDGVVDRALAEPHVVYVLGTKFPVETAAQPTTRAPVINNIHMNQGNSEGFADEDGVWQDGGLLFHFPSADRWCALFLAFESQSFKTSNAGHIVGKLRRVAAHARAKRPAQPMAPLGVSLSPIEADTEPEQPDQPGESFVSTALPKPAWRPLRVYAFDPSRGRVLGNEMPINIRYREVAPGPVDVGGEPGNRVAVIDYDGSTKRYYRPVDLDRREILLAGGLWPSESDPRFHQQMVYAVARDTIEHFEAALGRRIHWRREERDEADFGWKPGDILTLELYPHAMRAPNAYYSPSAHGVRFGYFQADRQDAVRSLPGQPVFTCLSHDVIVHEMTHAIVDGLRGHFIERTNRDVAAFHEGLADLAALFRHFSHREVLYDTLQRTGGRLFSYQLRPDAMTDESAVALASQLPQQNPLIELAQQFGDATGMRHALRSALGTEPTPLAYKTVDEAHKRGSILVAAVFDAFFATYLDRTADLFRIYRAGGGPDNPVDLPGPLANLLCDEATRTADEFFGICIRALDYCPPVDITFGEYLRAMITSEVDRDPDDTDGIRDALMQAFRLRGILPDGARFFSEEALCWTRGSDLGLPLVSGLHFGDPNALTRADRRRILPVLHGYIDDPYIRHRLGFDPAPELPVQLRSFHPVFRTLVNGELQRDMVVEVVQTKRVQLAPGARYPFRAGATLIIEPERHGTSAGAQGARVRWVVTKPMYGVKDRRNEEAERRHVRQGAFLARQGLTGDIDPEQLHVDFALVHGGV